MKRKLEFGVNLIEIAQIENPWTEVQKTPILKDNFECYQGLIERNLGKLIRNWLNMIELMFED